MNGYQGLNQNQNAAPLARIASGMRRKFTQEEIREILDYSQETGLFTWKVGNKIGIQADAGPPGGYRRVIIRSIPYSAHILAFVWMTGKYPDCVVDHIDRIKSNNKWLNLRDVTHKVNSRNREFKPNKKREKTQLEKVVFKILQCKRCQHVWPSKDPKKVKVCPKCKSPYWNTDRQEKELKP